MLSGMRMGGGGWGRGTNGEVMYSGATNTHNYNSGGDVGETGFVVIITANVINSIVVAIVDVGVSANDTSVTVNIIIVISIAVDTIVIIHTNY